MITIEAAKGWNASTFRKSGALPNRWRSAFIKFFLIFYRQVNSL